MSPKLDLDAIAGRIRGILASSDAGDLKATARRLRVDSDALARSVDLVMPYPSLSVITAVVREYGVDPIWLTYGEYDPTVHGLIADKGPTVTPADLLLLLDSAQWTRPDEPADQRPARQLGD
jgi:hypothetical protein